MVKTKLKTSIDNAEGMFVITDTSGVVRYANGKVLDETGFSLAETVGKRPGDLWGGHMDRSFYDRMWKTIKIEKRPFFAKVRNQTKDGKNIKKEMFFAPILGSKKQVTHYIEINPETTIGEEDVFKHEFFEYFSNQDDTHNYLIDFICRWLGQGGLSKKINKTLPGFFEDILIEPVERLFSNRLEDKVLIERAKEHPEDFRLLYEKYREEICRHFSYRVQSEQIALELTQDVFLNAFRYIDSFKVTNASYRTYLMRIAHNTLVNYYRDKTDDKRVNIDKAPRGVFGVEDKKIDPWMRKRLRDVMSEALTDTQMQIFKMKYFDGLFVREIATILQTSENAVKLHLHRGRKRMRQFLKDE